LVQRIHFLSRRILDINDFQLEAEKERELKHALLPSQIPIKQLLPKEVWRSMHVRSQKSDEK